MRIGLDDEKYLTMQSKHIKQRIGEFGDKLYLEFGGKPFSDYHASRALPGPVPNSKLHVLLRMTDQAEILIAINVANIEKNKVHHDPGVTHDEDVLRLIRKLRDKDLYVGSVVITQYSGQNGTDQFEAKLEHCDTKAYRHYCIEGYPSSVPLAVSDEGYDKNDYIETTHPLVITTTPGPGSGKMATCLSRLYHENKRSIKAGYAKSETLSTWNLPLKHPINLTCGVITADLNDVNMINPYHLEAHGIVTMNYNRDVDIFFILNAIFGGIYGESPHKSPTDMGADMAGFYIMDDETCCGVSKQEVIRRYYHVLNRLAKEERTSDEVHKTNPLMSKAETGSTMHPIIAPCLEYAKAFDGPAAAMELDDGTIVTDKTSNLLRASVAPLLNAIKVLGDIPHNVCLIAPSTIEPIQALKTKYMGSENPRLHTDGMFVVSSISTATDETVKKALTQPPKLRGCQVHTSVILSDVDIKVFNRLGVQLISEPVYEHKRLYR